MISTFLSKNSCLTKAEEWDEIHANMDDAYVFIVEPIIADISILYSKRAVSNHNSIDMLDELSISGKDLLSLLYSGVIDIDKITNKDKTKSDIRHILFKQLKKLGWSRLQILTAFRDIKNLFSTNHFTDKEIKYEFSK